MSENEFLDDLNNQKEDEFEITCKSNKGKKEGERILLLNEQGKIKDKNKKTIIERIFKDEIMKKEIAKLKKLNENEIENIVYGIDLGEVHSCITYYNSSKTKKLLKK